MPYRNRRNRRRNRRPMRVAVVNRRRFRKQRVSSVRSRGPIMADRYFTKLVYYERIALASTAGTVANYILSGNNAFDPNESSTGGQPNGFDQLLNLYSKWKVHGSKIDVQFVSTSTTAATQTFEFYIQPKNTAVAPTTTEDVQGNYGAKFALGNVTNSRAMRLRGFVSTAKMHGVPKKAISMDEDYGGTAVGLNSAGVEWYWHVGAQPADRSSTATAIAYAKVTYYVEFYDRQDIPRS